MINKKKMTGDYALNVIAVMLPTAVLQLIILPASAAKMDIEVYGLMTTVFAFFNLIPGTFGVALNNIRLIYNAKYLQRGIIGDFKIVLSVLAVLVVVFTAISMAYLGSLSGCGQLIIILTAVAWLLREYLTVQFRIEINYRYILINNALVAVGYCFGYMCFLLCGIWELVFLIGQTVCLPFVFAKSKLIKEPTKRTEMFKDVAAETGMFSIAAFLSRGVSYSDRLILYPMLGGHAVSIYYVSSLAGKILSMFVSPLSTVLLSYLAHEENASKKSFSATLYVGLAVCLITFVAIAFLARPFLTLLYPTMVDEAMPYVLITSGASLVYALAAILNTHLLKFYSMKWQIGINGAIFIVYVIVSVGLFLPFGLFGFCVGVLIAYTIKLFVTVYVFYKRPVDSTSVG